MKRKKISFSVFEVVTVLIAVLAAAGIFLGISAIILKGIPYIGQAVSSPEVIFAVKLSVYTASISTLICMFLALPAAYALTKTRMPLKGLVQIILELPLSLPYLVSGLSLLLVFSSDFGRWLDQNGVEVIFSRNGIIMAHIFVNLPFVIRIIMTSFQETDNRLEYISRMLGATKAKSFWTITLPLSKNAVAGALILAWSRALGEFGATLMLVGATRMKTETLPSSIYLNMAAGNIGEAMASATILLCISLLSQLLFYQLNKKPKKNSMRVY